MNIHEEFISPEQVNIGENCVFIHIPTRKLLTNCLFDSGALQDNYGSLALKRRLEEADLKSQPCSGKVCSCFGECKMCVARFVIFISCKKEIEITFPCSIKIIDLVFFELIIGRRTLQTHNESYSGRQEPKYSVANKKMSGTTSEVLFHMTGSLSGAAGWPLSAGSSSPVPIQPQTTNTLKYVRVPKTDVLDLEVDDSESHYGDPLERVDWWDEGGANSNDVQLHGPESLQLRLRDVLKEYADVFAVELDPHSRVIGIPPLELLVDESKWNKPQNRTPPRAMTSLKEVSLRKQVQKMLDQKIIQVSGASAHSHPHLVPKPGGEVGEFRFCIDLRSLNEATTCAGWPIPIFKGSERGKHDIMG
jgi:hypothetical protein